MKKLLATVTFALALSSFAAQKTSVSVAEPYLFTDETAEISGLPDGEAAYSVEFTDARTGATTTSSGKAFVTGGRASVEPVGEGLHALSFPGVPRPVRFLAFAPPPSVDAATLRRELPRAAEKLLGGKECRLLFLGDSVTATGEYGRILAKLIARATGNSSVVAEKRAHSGCSIDASVRDFVKEAGETRPDVVFTMYGLNDSAAGMSRAIFVRQLAWLRNHARDDFGAESVFVMPTPDHSDMTYRVREFDQAVADAAEALGVPYVDGFAAIGTNDFSRTYLYPPSYSAQFETHAAIGMEKGDRIHPNALGHLRLARAAFARLAGPSKRLKTIVVGETGRIDSPCGRSVSFRLTERADAYDVEIFGDGPYDGDVFTVFFDPRPVDELNTVGKYYWKDVKGREGQTSMKTTVPFSTWGGARPGDEIGFQFTWRRRRREGVSGSATIQWFPWEREWTPCGYGRLIRMKDYSSDRAFVRRYADAAVRIAKEKVASESEYRRSLDCRLPIKPRLSSGLPFIFVWDAAFCCLWAKDAPADAGLPVLETLDNMYLLQLPDGFICREYTPDGKPVWSEEHPTAYNPPVLAWAELELYRAGRTDRARLEAVYPKLVRFHDCYRRNLQRPDGLYAGDILGGGMDDIPRWPADMVRRRLPEGGMAFERRHITAPDCDRLWRWMKDIVPEHGWNFQAGWIDMSAQMAFDALNLAEIAELLGLSGDAAARRGEHAALARAINDLCWDESLGFYFDRGPDGLVRRWNVGSFWTLLAKVATPERARRMAAALENPDIFGRPVPVPSLAANDPDYAPETAYWRGAVWPPTTYMTILGLRAYGMDSLAERVARRWYNANAALFEKTGTIFENISPEQFDHPKSAAGRDFCGWSALAPVSVPALFGWR